MPQKLTISDYTFYFVRDDDGDYLYKDEQGNVFRRQHGEFQAMMQNASEYEQGFIIELYGITNIQNIKTKEYTLVHDIFEDLRDMEEK